MRIVLAAMTSGILGSVLGWVASGTALLPTAERTAAPIQLSDLASSDRCEEYQRRAASVLEAELRAAQQQAEELESFKHRYEGAPPDEPDDYPEPAHMRSVLEEIVASSSGDIASLGPVDCTDYPCAARIRLRAIGSDAVLRPQHAQIVRDLVQDHPELRGLTLYPRYSSDYDANVVVATVTFHGPSITAEELLWTMRTDARRSVTLDRMEAHEHNRDRD